MNPIIKQSSAWLPLAMSLTALAVLLGYFTMFGVAHETDEGAAAHIFQILMGGQVPIVVFFAIKWLPRAPKQALSVLALQVGAILTVCAPVFFFHL